MNKAILCGNVGSDPRTGKTNGGKTWASVSLATNEVWKDRNGDKQEKVTWHQLKFWGRQAEICEQYVRKGMKLLVEGRVEYGEYENKQGETVKTTDIVVFSMQMLSKSTAKQDGSDLPYNRDNDEEVPF